MVTFSCLMETSLPEWLLEKMEEKGMNAAELSRLTMDDVFMDHGTLRVLPYHTGKKSRPRECVGDILRLLRLMLKTLMPGQVQWIIGCE